MDAVEHERLGDVGAVGMREQARPEVVVLALLEAGVVAELLRVEQVAIEDDARMEERRAEEQVPAHLRVRLGHQVDSSRAAVLVDLEHARADDADRSLAQSRELALETVWQGDVVRVEPGEIAAASVLDRPVQRGGQAEPLRVRQDDETRVVDRREHLGRGVGRGVVDDDELELRDGLVEDALDGGPR